jgi:hypothetical protein
MLVFNDTPRRKRVPTPAGWGGPQGMVASRLLAVDGVPLIGGWVGWGGGEGYTIRFADPWTGFLEYCVCMTVLQLRSSGLFFSTYSQTGILLYCVYMTVKFVYFFVCLFFGSFFLIKKFLFREQQQDIFQSINDATWHSQFSMLYMDMLS